MTDVAVETCVPCAHAAEHSWWGPTIPAGSTHCGTCHRTWRGQTACHCTVCHETFASYFSSDLHWVRALNDAGKPVGEGRHTHPAKVAMLEPRVRKDNEIYWTKEGVPDDGHGD